MPLTFGSLFAGIGGFDLGFERAGMVCKWQVEKDPFCQKVLAKHWPNVERFEDVKEVGKHNLRTVDVICGGFPCQPHSYAGRRQASNDARDLWGEYARIISEIRPQWVVGENVPGLLTSENGQYFGNILNGLASMGYNAEWGSFTASSLGALHKRKRVFIIANSNGRNGNGGAKSRNGGASRAWVFSQKTEDKWTSYWQVTPQFCGVVNGLPNRVDRLKTLGNAVVPQVAEFIATLVIRAYNNGVNPTPTARPLPGVAVAEDTK